MKLALYKYDTCGYCARVLRTIRSMGLEDRIELRDVLRDPARREELFEARGRGTVPVLRIEDDAGAVRWMGESRDIVTWLETTFG
ncbi:MAG: glutaredoxin [Sandaracinus sp.]|nr:glutaredoxin [Sandaracinus sp.]